VDNEIAVPVAVVLSSELNDTAPALYSSTGTNYKILTWC